jgi:hypothetical protein
MKRVFLSYASGDENVARELAAGFRDAELSGWMDQSDIATGEAIAEKLKESLRQASAIVVLVSERSLKNQWVQFELGAAFAMGKSIIPVLIGEAGIESSLPDWLQGMVYLDARGRLMKDVAKEVAHALSSQTSSET